MPPGRRGWRPFWSLSGSGMGSKSRLFGLFALCLAASVVAAPLFGAVATAAAKVVVVPPGNRSAKQPPVSRSSLVRTAETRGTFDEKYKAVYESLAGDPQLIRKIVKVAARYDIDPIHLIGAIVGEHTYNVDVMDNLQTYAVKALAYLDESGLRFAYNGESIQTFLARPQFASCADDSSDFELWDCREQVWEHDFRGKTVGGVSFPDDRFGRVFFQPFFVGQTFGLGQLNPLAALSVADIVHDVAGYPVLDANHAPQVYQAVMDPDRTLNYMAAIIKTEIRIYRDVAGFDISGNPGITATLYNTGGVIERARALAAVNKKRGRVYPRENYYGWLVNDRLSELRKLLPES